MWDSRDLGRQKPRTCGTRSLHWKDTWIQISQGTTDVLGIFLNETPWFLWHFAVCIHSKSTVWFGWYNVWSFFGPFCHILWCNIYRQSVCQSIYSGTEITCLALEGNGTHSACFVVCLCYISFFKGCLECFSRYSRAHCAVSPLGCWAFNPAADKSTGQRVGWRTGKLIEHIVRKD